MNELTTFRWSLEEDVEHYQHAGYQSIGVWRQKLADGEEDRGIDLLAASGLIRFQRAVGRRIYRQ